MISNYRDVDHNPRTLRQLPLNASFGRPRRRRRWSSLIPLILTMAAVVALLLFMAAGR